MISFKSGKRSQGNSLATSWSCLGLTVHGYVIISLHFHGTTQGCPLSQSNLGISPSGFRSTSFLHLGSALSLNLAPHSTRSQFWSLFLFLVQTLKPFGHFLMSVAAEVGSLAHRGLSVGNEAKLRGQSQVGQWWHGICVVRQS